MTQMEAARKGVLTTEMEQIAVSEKMDTEILMDKIAKGHIAIPKNKNHNLKKAIGVGNGLKTKTNANIGTSTDSCDIDIEVQKAKVAVQAGADALMDLSTDDNLVKTRKTIMSNVNVVIGTVPVYQAAVTSAQQRGGIIHMTVDDMFSVLESQAKEGVDFFTIHCGVTQSSIARLKNQGRLTDIVSRGGSFMTTWMIANDKENPFYEYYDRVLEIMKKHDVTISLGDGLRPGSIADATDRAQIEELIILGELTQRAWEQGVQVMIEGPGHVPINQIQMNIELQKRICNNAPFYVLGPLVTDVAPGYDHITAAIGGAIAGMHGADFLCYVTPGEHLRLPSVEDVHQGVIAARIAAHAADIAKGIPGASDWDNAISQARKDLDWQKQIELSMDPELAKSVRDSNKTQDEDVCSMCGEYCAIKLVNESLSKK